MTNSQCTNPVASCHLYHKPITIVNDDSSVVNKLETLLIDDARVVIYDCRMFITQATGGFVKDSVLVTDNLRD
jgi:hypothetical protein